MLLEAPWGRPHATGCPGGCRTLAGSGFPAGTMAVNVLGSFLLGASLRYLEGVIGSGLVTLEKARVILYRPGSKET